MPNYYAHLTFGQRVLADLPAGLSELIEQEREAFDLGCLGPDPLFFYQPIRPNAVRREGIKMHRRSALPAVERLRQAIEDGVRLRSWLPLPFGPGQRLPRLRGRPGRRRPHLPHGH